MNVFGMACTPAGWLKLMNKDLSAYTLASMAVYAAVQYYKPRFETLIHSLYYGTNNPFLGTPFDPYA